MKIKRKHIPYLLCLPTFLYLLCLVMYPLIFSLIIAFRKFDPLRGLSALRMPYVGLNNFVKIFQDHIFAVAMTNTIIILLVALSIEFVLGFGIALLLNRKIIRGSSIFTTLLLTPMMMPLVAAGLMWRMMFHMDYGIINAFVKGVGISSGIDWLGSLQWVLFTIIVVDIWQWTPFVVLILLAGLRALPPEPLEAARVDGSSSWQLLKYIILPLLRWPIMIVLLIRMMDIFKIFDTVYALTYGGPGYASETISFHTYMQGFKQFKLGYAAALSWVILVIVITLSTILIRLVREKGELTDEVTE